MPAFDGRQAPLFSLAGRCCILSATGRSRDWPVRVSQTFSEPHRRERRFFESRRNPFPGRLHLEAQSLLWPSPPQWPARSRPFPVPPKSTRAEKFVRERFLHEGEDPERRAWRRLATQARARPGARGAGRRRQAPLDRLAARLLAAARARASALRGRAQAGRRHGPLGPPGGRPVGHSDRPAGRGAALRRQRQRTRRRGRLARAARLGGDPRPRRSAVAGGRASESSAAPPTGAARTTAPRTTSKRTITDEDDGRG